MDNLNSALLKKPIPPVPPKLPVDLGHPTPSVSSVPKPPVALSAPIIPSKPIGNQPLAPEAPRKAAGLGLTQLRTMKKDIEMLKKGELPSSRVAMPPKNLPISEEKSSQAKEIKKEATRGALGQMMEEVDEIRQQYGKEKSDIFSRFEKPNLFPPELGRESLATDRSPLAASGPAMPVKLAPAPISTPILEEVSVQKNRKSLWFVLIAIIILLAAAGGFVYWWKFLRQPITHQECRDFQCVTMEGEGENKCQIDDDCLPPEPAAPVSLLPGIDSETIEVFAGQESSFASDFGEIINQQFAPESFRQIRIKKVALNKEKKYASLSEMMALMEINIPLALRSNLEEDYTLFVYTPGVEEKTICQAAERTDAACFGPRLGLAVKLSDREAAIKELVKWETAMAGDLKQLILAETVKDATAKFQYSTLKNLKGASFIRYLNLPIASITIDYGVRENLLIISTSKNSFAKVLDVLDSE